MKTLKGWITTFALAVALMTSTVPVNAGVIIGGRIDQPCNGPIEVKAEIIKQAEFGGVIIGGLMGVIIGG